MLKKHGTEKRNGSKSLECTYHRECDELVFFARNEKLFKCVFWENYSGRLPNGITTGMSIAGAQRIDTTLLFDEWNEDYESPNGYWLEDDVENGKIISISIFIKELLDEGVFDMGNW